MKLRVTGELLRRTWEDVGSHIFRDAEDMQLVCWDTSHKGIQRESQVIMGRESSLAPEQTAETSGALESARKEVQTRKQRPQGTRLRGQRVRKASFGSCLIFNFFFS